MEKEQKEEFIKLITEIIRKHVDNSEERSNLYEDIEKLVWRLE